MNTVDKMRLVIEITEYDKEWIQNAYRIPEEINIMIAEAIINGEPERKKGKWIDKPDPYGFFDTIPVCSECDCTTKYREKYMFCPNCGADMRQMEGDSE